MLPLSAPTGLSEVSCKSHYNAEEIDIDRIQKRKRPTISDELLDPLLRGAGPKAAFAKDGLLDKLRGRLRKEP